MQVSIPGPVANPLELDAALLQAVITAGLATVSGVLFRRYRKAYFGWWTAAWTLYVIRIGAIIAFLLTAERWLLFAHQVITGWTALALLWSAVVFSRGTRLKWPYLAVMLFPPLWSAIAVYSLQNFLLAALPMVVFLSFATLWSAFVFFDYQRRVRSSGALLLATAFLLWGLHHLDYPFLRAQGAWAPWGYYLDIVFELAVGAGLLLLVLDDLGRGVHALSALSGDLQRSGSGTDVLDALLHRPLTLGTVRGTALYLRSGEGYRLAGGAGAFFDSIDAALTPEAADTIDAAMSEGRPQEVAVEGGGYIAVLPILSATGPSGALLLAGQGRDPFAALDDDFLLALGQQVGAALDNADLSKRLEARRLDLERLSARVVEQHEEERRRISRELHDESAQVFSAVKMELAMLRDSPSNDTAARLDRVIGLVDSGIAGIRNVVNDLRPSLLDDLGLLPALRSLADRIEARSGLEITFDAPACVPPLSKEAELVLYRAMQEALTNVVRHAEATAVEVGLRVMTDEIVLTVWDDGRGLPAGTTAEQFQRAGHMGLTGMRERVHGLGGRMHAENIAGGGLRVEVVVPAASPDPRPTDG
ncbi:MAG TPA: GAF domain-containing sensor histidine kinase [Gemmatimonadales bacterium]